MHIVVVCVLYNSIIWNIFQALVILASSAFLCSSQYQLRFCASRLFRIGSMVIVVAAAILGFVGGPFVGAICEEYGKK